MATLPATVTPPPQPPRLLDLVRQVARNRFGQDGPGERYADWARRLVLFHNLRHPRDLHPGDVGRFLEHVAQTEKDPLNRLEEAHRALTFLYHDVLGLDVGELPLPEPPRLLDRLRRACRMRQFSPRTEHCYATWAERNGCRGQGARAPTAVRRRPGTRQGLWGCSERASQGARKNQFLTAGSECSKNHTKPANSPRKGSGPTSRPVPEGFRGRRRKS